MASTDCCSASDRSNCSQFTDACAADADEPASVERGIRRLGSGGRRLRHDVGHPARRVYGPDDGEFPGQYPYTRGPYASMYRSKLWTMRMFAGFGTADDTNWRFKEIIKAGGDGSVDGVRHADAARASTPTTRCRSARSAAAASPSTRSADMEDLYAGIDLGAITTSMTINSPAAVIFAMFVAQAEKAGVPRARLGGTLQNDILKEYQAQKEFVFPPRPSMRLVRDTIAFTRGRDAAVALDLDLRLPHPRGRLDGGRGAGVHAGQRVRLRRAGDAGRACRSTRSRRGCRSSSTPTSTSSRRSPSTAPPGASGRAGCASATAPSCERSLQLRFHTQTAGVSLTAQQPEVNIVRTAIEALAGVLGGTQSLHTNSMDEAHGAADREGGAHRAAHAAGDRLRDQRRPRRRPARRLVLRRGAHRRDGASGRGASSPISTSSATARCSKGVITGIEDNWFQGQIADSAYELERAFNSGRRIVVGVNRFTEGNDEDADRAAADHQRGRSPPAQASRPGARTTRTQAAVDAALRQRSPPRPPTPRST